MNTAETNLRPNRENFDGAIAVSTTTFGLQNTPGLVLDAGTQRCQAVAEAAGMSRDVVFQGGGGACDGMWTLEAALGHASASNPEAILPGLFAAASVELSYPLPNATFRAPAKYTGGDTYWPMRWHADCGCWRVLDPNRRPIPAG